MPKSEPARPSVAAEGQRPSGSNRPLIITSIAVLALAAAGLTYRFVLRKPTVQTAPAVEAPAAAQPAASVPAEASPETTSPDEQPPATAETQPPAEAEPAGTAPAGNAVAGSAAPASPKVPKRAPIKPAGPGYAQAHNNAEQALAASQFLSPPDSSALFWARKAKALGDPGAAQLEQQVFAGQMAGVQAARQNHNFDKARALVFELASNFPDHSELRQLQGDIREEEQKYTQQLEEQRRQAELQAPKRFPVQHRHGTGSSFCTGIITFTPTDGTARYDCSTADSQGRCEHVTFAPGSLKEAKVRGDGSLHVATRQSGSYDFVGSDGPIKDAAAALGTLVKR